MELQKVHFEFQKIHFKENTLMMQTFRRVRAKAARSKIRVPWVWSWHLGLKPQIEFEIDGIASVLDLVHEGYGHTVLPLNSLRGHIFERSFIARSIVRPKLGIRLSLVQSAQRPIIPLARETHSLIQKTASRILFPEKP